MKEKDSRFEYLKIFAMLMIICHHLIAKNAFDADVDITGLTANKLFLQFIGNNAFIGNNLFFLVSAWFLSSYNSDINFKSTWRRIWRLEKVMLFYSIAIPVVLYIIDLKIYNIGEVKFSYKYLIPLSTNLWWYPTSYALFLLFYPFIQRLLEILTRIELRNLIFLMFSLWCIPSIIPIRWQLGANNTTTFLLLYAIVYYIRKYSPAWVDNRRLLRILIIGGYIIAFSSIVVLDYVGTQYGAVNKFSCYYIRGNWRILPFIISIGIFFWCIHLNVLQNKFINALGAMTFAVYLIHMHPAMIDLLFKRIFVIDNTLNLGLLVVYILIVTITIFVAAVSVEYLRRKLTIIFKYLFNRKLINLKQS